MVDHLWYLENMMETKRIIAERKKLLNWFNSDPMEKLVQMHKELKDGIHKKSEDVLEAQKTTESLIHEAESLVQEFQDQADHLNERVQKFQLIESFMTRLVVWLEQTEPDPEATTGTV